MQGSFELAAAASRVTNVPNGMGRRSWRDRSAQGSGKQPKRTSLNATQAGKFARDEAQREAQHEHIEALCGRMARVYRSCGSCRLVPKAGMSRFLGDVLGFFPKFFNNSGRKTDC